MSRCPYVLSHSLGGPWTHFAPSSDWECTSCMRQGTRAPLFGTEPWEGWSRLLSSFSGCDRGLVARSIEVQRMQVRSGGRRQAGQVPSCFQWETPESNGGFSLPFLALPLTLRSSCPGHRWLLTACRPGPTSSGLGCLKLQSRAEWHRTMPLGLCRATFDLSGCLALQSHLRYSLLIT